MLLFRPHALKYICRRCCVLSEIILWKLLTSRCSYCFWVLPECILATRSCSLKALLSAFAVVTVLWPFLQMFLKHSSPVLRNSPHNFPADSYLTYSCTKHRCCSTLYLRWGMLSHHCMTEIHIYLQQTQWFIVQVCCCWCMSYIPIWAVWESLHSRELDVVFGPYIPQF